uniref:alpha-L-fucosidase n=1 Tax=uncultured Draconibacterium sp. TaxID=1573823 RepID=UPI003217B780
MKTKQVLLNSLFVFLCLTMLTGKTIAQEKESSTDDPLAASLTEQLSDSEAYVWPKDPKVLENLKKWQGYKFGLLIHMGLYSELGIVESWALCPEDWIQRKGYDDYYQFCNDYRNTITKFNPVNYNPEKWAKLFKNSGAKYMIYSSKHHDGFCLYDTKYTDFKVTSERCPFSANPRSNVLKEVLDATRNEGLATGVYFSKPDWTSPYFWWPYYPPKDRNPTYDITKHPERWQKFVDYTQNQLNELTTEYGKVDILWLDGCWVLPKSKITEKVADFCKYPHNMDINMKLIAEKARAKQPGMLVVDRWVEGEYENYLTPEQKTPEKPLMVPWESCITMGGAWGWVKNDNYKSSKQLVHLLVNIVAKGGNLLLGIGPNGTGEFEPKVYENLEMLGKWLEANGEAIYETTPHAPFLDGKVAYTSKNDRTTYAIYMPEDGEEQLPAEIFVQTNLKGKKKVSLLASSQRLKYKTVEGGLNVTIPQKLRTFLAAQEAVVLKLEID